MYLVSMGRRILDPTGERATSHGHAIEKGRRQGWHCFCFVTDGQTNRELNVHVLSPRSHVGLPSLQLGASADDAMSPEVRQANARNKRNMIASGAESDFGSSPMSWSMAIWCYESIELAAPTVSASDNGRLNLVRRPWDRRNSSRKPTTCSSGFGASRARARTQRRAG